MSWVTVSASSSSCSTLVAGVRPPQLLHSQAEEASPGSRGVTGPWHRGSWRVKGDLWLQASTEHHSQYLVSIWQMYHTHCCGVSAPELLLATKCYYLLLLFATTCYHYRVSQKKSVLSKNENRPWWVFFEKKVSIYPIETFLFYFYFYILFK